MSDPLIKLGDTAIHPRFGEGRVVAMTAGQTSGYVLFRTRSTGEFRVLLSVLTKVNP